MRQVSAADDDGNGLALQARRLLHDPRAADCTRGLRDDPGVSVKYRTMTEVSTRFAVSRIASGTETHTLMS
jgi:hypothetical protein